MAGRFLLRRSQLAREQARRNLAAADHRLAKFAEIASSLANQIEAMPAGEFERGQQRNECVRLLREAAEEGVQAMWRVRSISPEDLDDLGVADRGRS